MRVLGAGKRTFKLAGMVWLLAYTVVAAGCSEDLGLEGEFFKCETDADCARGTVCHKLAHVCVEKGAKVPPQFLGPPPDTSDSVDATEAPDDVPIVPDAGPTDGETDTPDATEPDDDGQPLDGEGEVNDDEVDSGPTCTDECAAKGFVCDADGLRQECLEGPDGCLDLGVAEGCPAVAECQSVACQEGECVVSTNDGWCFVDEACVTDKTVQPGSGGCAQCAAAADSLNWTKKEDESVCFDDACLIDQECTAGVCGGGKLKSCDDGNGCTDETCDSDIGCISTANTAPCDDKDECTTGDVCGDTLCQGASVECNDGNPCTDDSCSKEDGCQAVPNSAACDDGEPCTSGDVCVDSQCTGPAPTVCDDAVDCTVDSCVDGAGCVHVPNHAACADDNPCNEPFCDPVIVGCTDSFNSDGCDDGDACTGPDVCKEGFCGGNDVVCNDSDKCTADSCDTDKGCIYAPKAACDDSDVCTSDSCVPATGSCAFTTIPCPMAISARPAPGVTRRMAASTPPRSATTVWPAATTAARAGSVSSTRVLVSVSRTSTAMTETRARRRGARRTIASTSPRSARGTGTAAP